MKKLLTTLFFLLLPAVVAWAGGDGHGGAQTAADIHGPAVSLIDTTAGYVAVALFVLAYCFVIFEEKIHMRKSKPVVLAAGIIWALLAITLARTGDTHTAHEAIKNNLLEYAELLLFLLSAMTYINCMDERNVFQALRGWLVSRGFSLRVVFWITGFLAFVISPVADNLTTALLMGAVVMAVAKDNNKFVALACVNIVVGANAGGAFSPFGDITTLMVWQKGKVEFVEFFAIFIPSLLNWLIPALLMNLGISRETPKPLKDKIRLKLGAKRIMLLFLLTIATAVSFHNFLHLPPAAGMMLGLGYLGIFSYYLKIKEKRFYEYDKILGAGNEQFPRSADELTEVSVSHFDMMRKVARAEWDTLLFFYGVILCVGGLSVFGYLAQVSGLLYHDLGPTTANVLVGLLSAIVDNIPVMFAVLTMDPEMSHGQWLLVTLTAGVGGSLLSIGSAAGVALMGTARGIYTFGAHLKWLPAIALGYAASIYAHLFINSAKF